MHRIKSLLLLAALTALVLWVDQALGGRGGFAIALVVAGLMNIGADCWSDRLVLRMYGAQEVSIAEAPELWQIVQDFVYRAKLHMPRLQVIPEEATNTFATRRNPQHAAVAVTGGGLAGPFSTYPSIEARIARLEAMAFASRQRRRIA